MDGRLDIVDFCFGWVKCKWMQFAQKIRDIKPAQRRNHALEVGIVAAQHAHHRHWIHGLFCLSIHPSIHPGSGEESMGWDGGINSICNRPSPAETLTPAAPTTCCATLLDHTTYV